MVLHESSCHTEYIVQYEIPISCSLKVIIELNLFKSRSNFKAHKFKIYGAMWKVCQKKYAYEIHISNCWKVMTKVKAFVNATNTDADTDMNTRAMA